MKFLKFILFASLLACTSVAILSCGGSTTASEEQGKEYTSTYVCPMHCEGSGSEEAGTCPVCGMDYVKNEDNTTDGHSHDGHDH